jgi:hypothetical protein
MNRLAELTWMHGEWCGEPGDDPWQDWFEDVLIGPAGDQLLGTWRFQRDGKGYAAGQFVIRLEGGKLVLEYHSVDWRFASLYDRKGPVVWPLIRSGPDVAVFEGQMPSGMGTGRLIYRRLDEDTLVVTLEGGGKRVEARYRRGPRTTPGSVGGESVLPH